MLLILHTHVVAAARTIHELNPVEKVQDLAITHAYLSSTPVILPIT